MNLKLNSNLEKTLVKNSFISESELKIRQLNLRNKINYILKEIKDFEINNDIKIDLITKYNLSKTIYNIQRNNLEVLTSNFKLIKNVNLVTEPKEILNIFNLRYKSFEKRDYNKIISKTKNDIHLNFDEYDNYSILLEYKRDEIITASSRIVLDNNLLLSEYLFNEKEGFFNIRNNKNIGEISRSVILPEYQNKGTEFKKVFAQIYYLKDVLKIENYITAIAKEDYKLYKKVGFEVIKEDYGYNEIKKDVLYLKWNVTNVNDFFKRVFLRNL